MTEHRIGKIEAAKFWADYFKHLTTVATGSILLISTFLEKLFSRPVWKAAVIVSLLGFLVCVVGSIAGLTAFAIASGTWKTDEERTTLIDGPEQVLLIIGIMLAWVGFLVGIISLTSFAIRNLL